MICRRPLIMAAAVAASMVLAARPSAVRADAISSSSTSSSSNFYVLTTTQDIPAADPTSTTPQVIFEVPSKSIVAPPDPSDTTGKTLLSPLTPITQTVTAADGTTYTTSPAVVSALGTGDVVTALKGGPNPTDPPEFLGFIFHNGLSHNQQLVFSLNVLDPNNPPTLFSDTAGVPNSQPLTPAAQTAPATTAAVMATSTSAPIGRAPGDQAIPPTSSITTTPEPLSLALWSMLAGAGLFRARCYRRRRAA